MSVHDIADAQLSLQWLHRSAFAFGGVFNHPSLRSSQLCTNLVFGSTECNTHMIRAENAIVHAVSAIGRKELEKEAGNVYGVLTTTNVRTGNIERLRSDGGTDNPEVTKWVDVEKYSEWHLRLIIYQR